MGKGFLSLLFMVAWATTATAFDGNSDMKAMMLKMRYRLDMGRDHLARQCPDRTATGSRNSVPGNFNCQSGSGVLSMGSNETEYANWQLVRHREIHDGMTAEYDFSTEPGSIRVSNGSNHVVIDFASTGNLVITEARLPILLQGPQARNAEGKRVGQQDVLNGILDHYARNIRSNEVMYKEFYPLGLASYVMELIRHPRCRELLLRQVIHVAGNQP